MHDIQLKYNNDFFWIIFCFLYIFSSDTFGPKIHYENIPGTPMDSTTAMISADKAATPVTVATVGSAVAAAITTATTATTTTTAATDSSLMSIASLVNEYTEHIEDKQQSQQIYSRSIERMQTPINKDDTNSKASSNSVLVKERYWSRQSISSGGDDTNRRESKQDKEVFHI